ncbi:methyl jasmonate esterase 1-like isoform X1 [Ziziphus jujuba]|uniref:Methyl jasmonate esterase 1-like isoform X1 n=1 Tax=Ziziphus jujuba TaxID=326968 RepID=A0ABM3IWP2_ZIZJJ|nr:methyl jasmonate esterase 1-like isoform X1 [Ziziphus jujuba]XP_048336716.1 methyl jasmonate esterase 1-like isoform X1 [Ziziphus jujuba]
MDQRKQYLTPMFCLLIIFSCKPNRISSNPTTNSSKHFVLVHGSCHGAWSWYKLIALLKSSGHTITALDLAASGVDLNRANDLPSISDYFKPLRKFMAGLHLHERVILVAHSLGGLAISQAMEIFPHKISVAVFVTALMPGPALNISTLNQESFRRQNSLMDSRYTYDNGPNKPPTTFVFGPLYLASRVYQFSPPEDLALATVLMRPRPLFSEEDMYRELIVSEKRYGSVNRVYIVSEKDMVGTKDFQWWMIERNKPNGVVEIKGSDHMVMMSKPLELCFHLQAIAEEYS